MTIIYSVLFLVCILSLPALLASLVDRPVPPAETKPTDESLF